jgi:hypothetical protein
MRWNTGWWWLLVVAAVGRAEPPKAKVLFDFERGGLQSQWTAADKLSVRQTKLPQPATGSGVVPAGIAAQIDTPARGRLVGKANQVPRDWAKYGELSLWVYRTPEEARRVPTLTFEVAAFEADSSASFWRRVDVTREGWQQVTLPLKWFRQDPGAGIRWDRIERVEFRFREEAHLWIDAVALHEGTSDTAAYLSARDVSALAFPGVAAADVRETKAEHAWILTDVPDLDLDKLSAHLKLVSDAVYGDLPFLEKPVSPPLVVVFSTRGKYQAFSPALGKLLNAQIAVPQSGGYTIMGIATSSWDPAQGTLRPVYAHEFVHALLENCTRLGNRSEWFHEGFANYYQLKFHPQKNFRDIVVQGLKNPQARSPLRELTAGTPISGERYWQAATVVDLFLANDQYHGRLGELFRAFQKSRSTALAPHLEKVLNKDFDKFEQDWRARCAKAYPPAKQ